MDELLDAIMTTAVAPALRMLPVKMDSADACALLLAIGLQESRLTQRYQVLDGRPGVKGPARGITQFERGTVALVMRHAETRALAQAVCFKRGVPFEAKDIHERMERDDVLAMAFARLLLWADVWPLPKIDGPAQAAWDTYERVWRPGKPHRETWDAFWTRAVTYVAGMAA